MGAHLRAVWALPDNRHIWVGGDYATLLHSHDEGRTWSQIKIGDIPAPQLKPAPGGLPPVIQTQKPPAVPNPAAPGVSIGKVGAVAPTDNVVTQVAPNAAVCRES